MGFLDRIQQVIGGVVDTGDDVAISPGVGGPEDEPLIDSSSRMSARSLSR